MGKIYLIAVMMILIIPFCFSEVDMQINTHSVIQGQPIEVRVHETYFKYDSVFVKDFDQFNNERIFSMQKIGDSDWSALISTSDTTLPGVHRGEIHVIVSGKLIKENTFEFEVLRQTSRLNLVVPEEQQPFIGAALIAIIIILVVVGLFRGKKDDNK